MQVRRVKNADRNNQRDPYSGSRDLQGVISEQINCREKGEKRAKISELGNTHWLLKIQ